MNAAYFDHLKDLVNTDNYMKTVHSAVLSDANTAIENLFTFILSGEVGANTQIYVMDEAAEQFAYDITSEPVKEAFEHVTLLEQTVNDDPNGEDYNNVC